MMESEFNNQNDLLHQLKMLRAEKELLEKHVFVLNECLSIDELRAKISDLEKKKEMISSLEKLIAKLRAEIEPLKYLKSILENKLEFEDQKNNFRSQSCIDLKPNVFKFDTNISKTSLSQMTHNIPTESIKKESVSSQKLYDVLSDTNKILSNTASVVTNNSIDECMQFLEQYDVVTDQEILNFSEEKHSKTQNIDKESTLANLNIEPKASTSTNIEAEGINIELNNYDSLSVKENVESCVKNVVTNSDNNSTQLHEASSSNFIKNSQSVYSDPKQTINDLLLKIPQLLLQQGLSSVTVEDKLNESLKYVNESLKGNTENNKISDKVDYFNVLKKEVGSILAGYEQLLLNNAPEIIETNKNESKEPSTSTQSGCEKLLNSENRFNDEEITNKNEPIESTEFSQHSESKSLFTNSFSEKNINSFNEMNLKIDILRGIYSLGFVNPTGLQKRVIVHCLNGRDIIVLSGPGNGRTMMFTIPILQRINTNLNECQVLIIVPTRDLAVHIQKIILSVGDFMGVNVCIGGDNVPRKLTVIPHVIVGTPAGIFNMIACKSLRTGCIHTVVMNQVEKMLSNSSIKLIEKIVENLPINKQITLLTSDRLDHVLDTFMDTLRDPLVIINEEKEKDTKILKNLPKQFYLNIQENWKMNALCEIVESLKLQKTIIFCNSVDRAEKLCESLQKLDYAVSLFHLEISATEREKKLNMFNSNMLHMLITTDPIKGNQFQNAAWIINYDLPINSICYLDRVAKSAENLKVINLINEFDDLNKLAIETYNKSYFIQMPLNMIDLLQY
uniref:ATP-dependent RNA helicase n=2 Tax=Sipha flava TaxID=143950 RepID=A0A2S2R0L8_9HEMI